MYAYIRNSSQGIYGDARLLQLPYKGKYIYIHTYTHTYIHIHAQDYYNSLTKVNNPDL